MRRWVIACFTLALCVPTVVLWVMSSRPHVWWFGPDRPEASFVIVLHQGAVAIHDRRNGLSQYYDYGLWRPFAGVVGLWASPFLYRHFRSGVGVLAIVLFANAAACGLGQNLPAFFLVLVLDGLFFVLILRDLLAPPKKVLPGICAFCGYDLRATPERCPECGRIPEKAVP